MQLCFLISRLALWAHNLISQLTLYDTPRATEISASPPSKKMQSNSIQVENETEPILIRSVCKQSYKLSSALVEATTPEPRIENREWRIELKKTFQTSFSSHLQLEREEESVLKINLQFTWKLQTHSKDTFSPPWDEMPLNSDLVVHSERDEWQAKTNNPIPSLPPSLSLPRWPGQLTSQS